MSSVTSKPGSKIDRQAVLDVLKGVYDAWEANDAEAFVSDYLEDAAWCNRASTRKTDTRSRPR